MTELQAPTRTTLRRHSCGRRRPQPGHIPGETGTWVFILGDLTVFTAVFAVYLATRSHDPELFRASQGHLNVAAGAVNTLLLLSSSLLVVAGVGAIRRRAQQQATWMLAGAFACGAGFIVNKYIEYSDKLSHGLKPATNDFWMYYYVLTGLHLFHLLVGLVILALLIAQARRPTLTAQRFAYVEGGACFWHMVDLLWIVIFPLLYLAR